MIAAGVRLSAVLLAAVLAAVAGSALSATRQPGAPPLRPGAGLYLCPPQFSVAAYRSDRVGRIAFAPLHPSHPAITVPIARCYGSLAAAKRLGYRPAAVPTGDLEIRGIYLLPAGGPVQEACRSAADTAGFPVPCPRLLPTRPYWQCPCTDSKGFLLMVWGTAPASYLGDQPGSIHLVFGASHDPASPWISCRGATNSRPITLAGTHGTLLDCPPASMTNGGHLLFTWRAGGITYAVSAHGHSTTNRKLLAALLSRLKLIPPTPK